MDIGTLVNIIIFVLTIIAGLVGWQFKMNLATSKKTDENSIRITTLEDNQKDFKGVPVQMATLIEKVENLVSNVKKLEAAVNRRDNPNYTGD